MPYETVMVVRSLKQARALAVAVAASQTVVLGPVDLLRYDVKCFTVRNPSGAGQNALSTAKIQSTVVEGTPDAVTGAATPSTVDADWEDQDTTTFATLATGTLKSKQFSDDAHRFWRLVATSASGTKLDAWIDAGT